MSRNSKNYYSDIFFCLSSLKSALNSFHVQAESEDMKDALDLKNDPIKEETFYKAEEFVKVFENYIKLKFYVKTDIDREIISLKLKGYPDSNIRSKYNMVQSTYASKIQRMSHRFWRDAFNSESVCPKFISDFAEYSTKPDNESFYVVDDVKDCYRRATNKFTQYIKYLEMAETIHYLDDLFSPSIEKEVKSYVRFDSTDESRIPLDKFKIKNPNIIKYADYFNALLFVANYSNYAFRQKLNSLDKDTLSYILDKLNSSDDNVVKFDYKVLVTTDAFKTSTMNSVLIDNLIKARDRFSPRETKPRGRKPPKSSPKKGSVTNDD